MKVSSSIIDASMSIDWWRALRRSSVYVYFICRLLIYIVVYLLLTST